MPDNLREMKLYVLSCGPNPGLYIASKTGPHSMMKYLSHPTHGLVYSGLPGIPLHVRVASPEAAVAEIRKYNAMQGVCFPFFFRGPWQTYTEAGDTLVPGQHLPGLTPAEAAILVPHHGAAGLLNWHAPPPPAPPPVPGPLMQMMTAVIAGANAEPTPPPPALTPIAVDDPDLLMRALFTLLHCQVAGDIPNLDKETGPSIRCARRTLERSDPPINYTGLSALEIKCTAWLCEYAHVAGPVARGAIRRACYGTIRDVLHRASVAAGFDNSAAGFIQSATRLAPTYLAALREASDTRMLADDGDIDRLGASLQVEANEIPLRSWLGADGTNANSMINRHDLLRPDVAFWAPDGNAPPTPPPSPPIREMRTRSNSCGLPLVAFGLLFSLIAIGCTFDFHAIIGASKDLNLLSLGTKAAVCPPALCVGWCLISALSWLLSQMLAKHTGAAPERRHPRRRDRTTPDTPFGNFYCRCLTDNVDRLSRSPSYLVPQNSLLLLELLVSLYFMYGMRALDHREVETSSSSWLAEGHHLGPHSSLRLHPDVHDLFSPLRCLPSRDGVYVSVLTAPVRIINPIASWLVRLSACGLSAVVGEVDVV